MADFRAMIEGSAGRALITDTDLVVLGGGAIFDELAGDPTIAADHGGLYVKDDATDTELYFRSNAGIVQITKDGVVNAAGGSSDRTIVSKATGDTPYAASWGETIRADISGGDLEIDLPTAVGNTGKYIEIVIIGGTEGEQSTNLLTIDPNGTETLNGVSASRTEDVYYSTFTIISDGTNCFLV